MLRAVCDWVYIAPETLNSEWAGAVRTIRCALNLYIQPPLRKNTWNLGTLRKKPWNLVVFLTATY